MLRRSPNGDRLLGDHLNVELEMTILSRWLALVAVLAIVGCSVTGQVSNIDNDAVPVGAPLAYSLADVVVSASRGAEDNHTVRVFNWGKFDDKDLEVISASVDQSLRLYDGIDGSELYDVCVRIHRYAQTITNSSYAALVVVDWALLSNTKVLHDEVFFAGHDAALNIFLGKTLGRAKNTTNTAIVNRIANQVVRRLSDGRIDPEFDEANAYETADELIAVLPESMTSVGAIFVEPGVGVGAMSDRTEATEFSSRARFEKVNWERANEGSPESQACSFR